MDNNKTKNSLSNAKSITATKLLDCFVQRESAVDLEYRCPVCSCKINCNDEQEVCKTCETPHHKVCYQYAGGCAIFGCRKTAVSKESVGPSPQVIIAHNRRLIRIWNMIFRLQWSFFLVAVFGIIVFCLVPLVIAPLLDFSSLNESIVSWPFQYLWFALTPVAYAIPLSIVGYIFMLPAAIGMRIHSGLGIQVLPEIDFEQVRSLADEVDLSKTIFIVRKTQKILINITNYLLFLAIAGLVLCGLVSYLGYFISMEFMLSIGVSFSGLLFLRIIMLPINSAAIESRVNFLAAFQNRLIESVKQVGSK